MTHPWKLGTLLAFLTAISCGHSSPSGNLGTGGATSLSGSSGGDLGQGGSSARGGVTSQGGSSATGGATSQGGSSARGGVTSQGGSSATGGATGAAGGTEAGATSTAGLFLNGMFMIGVYGPEMTTSSFTKWKCLGINTVVDVPDSFPGPDSDVTTFDNLARQVGLHQIRQPFLGGSSPGTTAGIKKDAGNTSLLAFSHIDEPNNNCGTAMKTSSLCTEYSTWKAALPDVPIYTGFSGGDVVSGCTTGGNFPGVYTDPSPNGFLAATDWISNDHYPVSGHFDNGSALDLMEMLKPIVQFQQWAPEKPEFVYIEASRISQNSIANSVTGAQMTAEIWAAIVQGARGIIYFPEVVASDVGFRFDGSGDSFCANSTCDPSTWTCPCNDSDTSNNATCDDKSSAGDPQGVSAAMVAQNTILGALGPVLQGDINPSDASISVASPLFAGWRIDANNARWFIVVNPSGTAVSKTNLTLTGATTSTATVYGESRTVPISGGVISDSFKAYEVHIYSAAN